MNVAEGSFVLFGFLFLMVGIVAKLTGVSLFAPLIYTAAGYLAAANSCFLLTLIMGKFKKN